MSAEPLTTERLWELLSERLRGFLSRQVGDAQVAEDLLQEVFLRIHKGLDQLGDEDRLEPWVFRIARNLLIDQRRARVLPTTEAEPGMEEAPGAQGEENLNDVVRDWLPAMVDQLPAPYAEAVRLYEFDGLPQERIAEDLGLSLSGAKSRVQRGRAKLKELLLDCCSFECDRRGNVLEYRRNRPEDCGSCEEE